ncbi:hypothetical protein EV368DRAFT_36740 [Lentinula lateritia]|nr:hypothetical protein EV368DRAFT_36740 [Lentinula lateritia]
MEWQEPFKKAVAYFKRSKYGECLRLLNYALENGGRDQYAIYDSRAAVHEKTLRLREALLDVKEAIRLAPNRWQCYSRAARLFLLIRKFEEASKMVDIALQKINPSDDKNRATLVALQSQVIESRKRLSCHVGMLPVELLSSIFQYMVEEEPVLVIKISRVCRHWRTVALGDAALWSTLVLSKKDPNRKSKCWIQRSRGRIRELCLRRTLSDKVDWSLEKLGGIQWDYIRTCQLEDIDILKQLEKADALHVISQLETLVIRDKLMDSREEFVSYLSDNLRHLTIDGALHVWLKATITLAHLTVLDYCSGSTQLFKFLRLPSLQVISIQTCIQTKNVIQCLLDSGTSQLKSITFDSCAHLPTSELIRVLSSNPFVASLTLKKFGGGTVTPILDLLGSSEQLCPALTHLDLSSSSEVSSHLLIRIVSSRITAVVESLLGPNEETPGRPRAERIHSLIVDGCTGIDSDTIPWFRERVPHFSYVTRQWNGGR